MEYLIREIQEKDLPCLIELCKNHAEYEQAPYDATGKLDLLKKEIFSDNKRLHCLVVECQSQLIGYYTYTFDFSTWDAKTFMYLDCLYLKPDFRGMKIGEKIFENLKEIATLNNCVNIQWQTPNFNQRAIKFYEKIGGTGKDKVRFFINL
jgi:ribosomal protein S18 acetylase RimI-like enzyme